MASQNVALKKESLFKEKMMFFQKFTQLLEEENIIKDNIYTMIDIKFMWKVRLLDEMKTNKNINTNMEKLKDDSLTIIFCTNATGYHKLIPFCTYTYNDRKSAIEYLENVDSPFLHKLRKSELLTKKRNNNEVKKLETKEANDNFVDWYNNYFTKSIRDQQKVTGKVLLLLSMTERFMILEKIIEDNSFEILHIPPHTTFQPLNQTLRNNIRDKYRCCFPYFCVLRDLDSFITQINKPWMNLTPVDIQTLWKRLFKPNFLTEEDNITKKDTVEEISKPQSSRETERDKQEHTEENTISAANSGRIENTESTEEKVEEDYLTHKRELEEKPSNYIDLNKVPDLKYLLGPSSSSDDSTEERSSFGKAKGKGTSGIVGNN